MNWHEYCLWAPMSCVHWLGKVISLRIYMGDLYRCSVVLFLCDFSHWIYYDLGPDAPSWVSSDHVICWHMSIPVCYVYANIYIYIYMHKRYINMACSYGYVSDKGPTQIIDLINKSHNAPVPYPTMHHSGEKCAHFCSEWCIVGYETGKLWDLGDWPVLIKSLAL